MNLFEDGHLTLFDANGDVQKTPEQLLFAYDACAGRNNSTIAAREKLQNAYVMWLNGDIEYRTFFFNFLMEVPLRTVGVVLMKSYPSLRSLHEAHKLRAALRIMFPDDTLKEHNLFKPFTYEDDTKLNRDQECFDKLQAIIEMTFDNDSFIKTIASITNRKRAVDVATTIVTSKSKACVLAAVHVLKEACRCNAVKACEWMLSNGIDANTSSAERVFIEREGQRQLRYRRISSRDVAQSAMRYRWSNEHTEQVKMTASRLVLLSGDGWTPYPGRRWLPPVVMERVNRLLSIGKCINAIPFDVWDNLIVQWVIKMESAPGLFDKESIRASNSNKRRMELRESGNNRVVHTVKVQRRVGAGGKHTTKQ